MKFPGRENFVRLARLWAVGFLLCLGSLIGGDKAEAATSLNSFPAAGGVITAAGSPYLVNVDTLTVAAGTTVTIEPGVIIKMKTGLQFPVQFNVSGTLIANGTAEAPVIITSYKDDTYGGDTNGDDALSSPAIGDWNRIIATQSGASVQLNYTTLRYGGSGSWGALTLFNGGDGAVSHSTIEYAGYGIYVYGAGSELYLSDSIIRHNSFGVYNYIGGKSDIVRSVINNNATGLRFSDTAASQLSVANSSIYGNTSKGLNYTFGTGTLAVPNNWWGSSTGPTNAANPGGVGDVVAGDVSFSPWTTQDPANQPPALSYINTSGYTADGVEPNISFKMQSLPVFKVLYSDPEGVPANYMRLVTASSTFSMATGTAGVYEFTSATSTFAKTSYSYHFEASDGASTARLPASGELSFEVRNTPVLLVPGIMGTEMWKGDDKIWPDIGEMFFDAGDDFMNVLAINSDDTVVDNQVITGDIVRNPAPGKDVFESLISQFANSGYQENTDLFVFPYDWRLDIRTTSDSLKNKIDAVKSQTGASKADVVAHSMGGLLTKQYILENGSSSINKLIFIGAPHLGSPKSTKTLLFGDNLGVEFLFPFLDPDRIKYLAQNMYSIYELLPTQEYFTQIGTYYGELGGAGLNYAQTKQYLIDSGMNSILLSGAESFHSVALDNFSTSGLDVYNINGCNTPTISSIIKRTDFNNEYMAYMTAGDGTVPLGSSKAINTDSNKTYYFKDIQHATMPSADGIKQVVKNIIVDETIVLPANATQDSSVCKIEGEMVSVHSPVNLHIYDSSGNHVGRGENGETDYNISGVTYEEIGENKFVFLPTSGGQTYRVELDGTGVGTYSLRVSKIEDNQVVETAYYSDLPVNTSTEATVTLASSVANTVLQVDQNGTGSFSPVTVSAVLNSAQAADITQPSSTITVSGNNTATDRYQTSATVSLSSMDDNAGVLKTEYSLNNGTTWNTYSNSFIITALGSNTIQYRATDRAGNVEAAKSKTIEIVSAPGAVIIIPSVSSPIQSETLTTPQVLGETKERPANEQYTKDQILDALTTADTDMLLDYLGKTRDVDLEARVSQNYDQYLVLDKAALNFVAYGTKSTEKLGIGERAGVLRSYQYAFGKLPQIADDWQDVVNIATNQLPIKRSSKAEQSAQIAVRKIYGKLDNQSVMFIAYGLRPEVRDIKKERTELRRFGIIFGKMPSSVLEWNIFRKLVYQRFK